MCAIQVQKSCGFPAVTSGGIKRVGEQSVPPIRVFPQIDLSACSARPEILP